MELRTSVLRLAVAACLALSIAPLNGQATSGQWSAVFDMPLVAVHAALMRTGQLLFFDAWEIPGTPSARLWNPSTNVYTAVPNGFAELFCAGHILTSDGRLLTTGGHNGAGVGTTDATVFDPATLQWTALANLTYARWYPSVVQLPDGRALTMGGAISRPDIAEVPEALAIGANAWTTFPAGQKDVGEYPMMFQGPDGRIFVSGFDTSFRSWLYDVGAASWAPLGVGPAMGGTAVMYRPGKVMMTGGGLMGADPVTPATGVIDLTVANPAWRQTASMAFGRSQHNLVILPDGKVLVVGGAAEVSLVSTQPVLPAEIWDPDTETWTQVAAMARPRMYHSIAILLPDGRVLAAGGGRLGPNELNGEFYSPPYLFRGARPSLTSAPTAVNYGASFAVGTPDAANIARVTLVRASSVTHGVNLDQRFFELPFSATGGSSLSVQAPSDPRSAPAGDYLLFVLNGSDVPSAARVVRLGGVAGPPALSIADASANEGTSTAGSLVFTVTLSGAAAQTVSVGYSTADGTAQAGSDYSSRSGTLSFAPGTVTRTITVPAIADTLIEPNETFTVALGSAVNATIADGVAVGTVVNDDVPASPAASINSVSVIEGSGAGTPVAAFTVTLSSAPAASALVSYRTWPGSAGSPADFTSTTGTLTFAGGTTSQTIQVPIVPDTLDEPNETFTVELYNPVNVQLGAAVGTATILDDDSAGGPVTATYVIASGADDVNEESGALVTDGTLWAGNGSSATASYLGLRFTGVTIPAGATVTSARLEVTAATTQWTAVAFAIGAEAAGNSAAFGAGSGPSTRALVAPTVAHASDAQWLAGTRYPLDDITAVIQAVVGQPGWNAGQALSVIVRGTGGAWARKFIASAEGGAANAPRLVVTYSSGGGPANQPPVIASATATPASGPAPLAVSFNGSASDPEGAPLTYTWTYGTGATGTGASPSYTYASAGTYTAQLTVSDGSLTATSAPITVTVGAAALPALSIGDVSVGEGQSGTTAATFTVTLSPAATATVTVNYATANGTAVAPGDYTATSGTLTFTPGATTRTVSVPVVGDTVVEATETFAVTLSGAVGATIGDGSATGTILNDDSAGGPVTATFVVAANADDVNEAGGTFTAGGTTEWLGNGSSATASYLGLRFTGVTIPAGATITAARLEVTASATQWNAVAFELGAEAAANSAAFSAASRPSGRALVTPRVAHASNVQWVAGTRYPLDDIRTVVQAVVSLPGWNAGQALSVIVRGTSGAWARKFISSREAGTAAAPRLVVTYTVP